MDNEKKRKKNKKKKNKQQQAKAAADDTASDAGETSSMDQNHVAEKNHLNLSAECADGVTCSDSNKVVEDKGGHNADTMNGSLSAEIGKQNWLQEEARLREMVKQLLYEKDSYIQQQAHMEMQIKQLQSQNDSWHQKERNLQEKIRHIEKDRVSLVEKENSSKEKIAILNDENKMLRMQVMELEGAKNNLSQENRQLLDNISTLQLRIQDLERSLSSAALSSVAQKDVLEKADMNAEIEAASALIDKLVTENAELVEKLNELYKELSQQSAASDIASVVIPNYATVPGPISGSSEGVSSSAKTAKLFETGPVRNDQGASDDIKSEYANVARHSSETTVSSEIVQIPLDENEAPDLEAQAYTDEGDESVPLIDAPLIGAPFRLVSFFASYVSGADLVNKSSSGSLQ